MQMGQITSIPSPNKATNQDKPSPNRATASTQLSGAGVILTWVASILLHIVLLGVMLWVVFPFSTPTEEALPVALTEYIGTVNKATFQPSPIPSQAESSQPTPAEAEHVVPEIPATLADLGITKNVDVPIIGIGTGKMDMDSYGLSGGAKAPDFFGLGSSAKAAKRVVYVVDRSGSMTDTFQHVRAELTRSISSLRRSQKFHVIFFNAGVPLANPPHKLVSAIKAQKKSFFDFLQTVRPDGSTHPEIAMRQALELKPDMIYFLTDGEFDPSLVGKLDQWNSDRKVQIFTIAYFDPGGAKLLELIAREHQGAFKFITELDLP